MSEPREPNHADTPLTSGEAQRFAEHVAILANAGLPFAPGLRATALEMQESRVRSALRSVASRLETGVSLDEALVAEGSRLPVHLQSLIRAGSRAGQLGAVLGRYVGFKNVGEELRRKLWINLAYPLTALLLAFALISFVCTVLVGMYAHIFRDFGVSIPTLTRFLIQLSELIEQLAWPLLAGTLALLLFWGIAAGLGRTSWQRSVMAGIPLLGQVWRNQALAEFCHLLALMIESNVPLVESVALTGDGVGDASLQRACRELEINVRAGLSLSEAVARQGIFPPGLARVLNWAETSHSLPGSLRMAGEIFEARARTQADFTGTVLLVITMITVFASVAAIVVGLLLPLVTLISRLSG